MIEALQSVGVVGLGVMGFDIAFLYAQKGYPTFVYDGSAEVIAGLASRRERMIERLQRRRRISDAETERVRHGLTAVSALADLAGAALVTEAVSESAATKTAVYRGLYQAGFSGILTTNTSSLTRASLIAASACPEENFATTHFFNPVLYTQIVEVVKGGIAPGNYTVLTAFLNDLGRRPVETGDISGFVSNSVLMVYAVMALRLIEMGATIEAIDGAAKELRALPPLLSFDSWKPSIVEDVTRIMFELRADRFLRSSRLLIALARHNPVFYIDQKPNPAIYELVPAASGGVAAPMIKLALLTAVRLAAARTVELGESPAIVDLVCTEGLKFPRGPLAEIDQIGVSALLADAKTMNAFLPDDKLEVPRILVRMAERGETFFKDGEPNPRIAADAAEEAHARH